MDSVKTLQLTYINRTLAIMSTCQVSSKTPRVLSIKPGFLMSPVFGLGKSTTNTLNRKKARYSWKIAKPVGILRRDFFLNICFYFGNGQFMVTTKTSVLPMGVIA